MDPTFASDLESLVTLYVEVKKLILEAEELDARLESNIAVFKEQRDALDHLMRAFGKMFSDGSSTDTKYLLHQIDKAKGHLYRAAFDALDGIVVSSSARIREEYLKDISPGAIQSVMPEYWNDYLPRLEKLRDDAAHHRAKKDVGDLCGDNFTGYKITAFEVLSICNNISSKLSALREYEQRLTENEARINKRTLFYKYIYPIVLIVLGVLFGKILG